MTHYFKPALPARHAADPDEPGTWEAARDQAETIVRAPRAGSDAPARGKPACCLLTILPTTANCRPGPASDAATRPPLPKPASTFREPPTQFAAHHQRGGVVVGAIPVYP